MKTQETITIPKYLYEMERKMRFFEPDLKNTFSPNKRNIFVGISISNKHISSKMACNYLRWAIENTKEKVAIVIADELNRVNYELLDGYSSGKARNRARKVGDLFESKFKEIIKKLPKEKQKKIQIYRWERIRNNSHYEELRKFLQEQYYKDHEFKSAVLFFIKKYMRKKGKIIYDPDKIDSLATYIIGELPTLLEGIVVGGNYYGLCIYPTYFASGMSQLVMDIHNEELGIGKKINSLLKEKAILVEAWLD